MSETRLSDRYWEERRARRNRRLALVVALTLLVVVIVGGLRVAYVDTCTRSDDRSAGAVVDSFLAAVRRGDRTTAANCWRNEPFVELLVDGCGERCLNGFYRADFTVESVQLAEPAVTDDGRLHQRADVSGACADGTRHSGYLTLDTTPRNFPWRHWKIVYGTVGGEATRNWCE